MASGTGLSLALALTLAAFAGVALVDAQLGDGDILGAARDIAFDTGAKTEIGTPLGPVIGKVVESADGEHKHIQFLGIPYAEPPVNEFRFKDPVAKREWKDAYDATEFGASCLQMNVLGGQEGELVGDEDCLFLNVFTPRVPAQNGRIPNKASLLSVMVWLHGGDFNFGDGRIDPTPLVDQNIIVVSMNYRLGPIGFLNLGTPEAPGNMGLRDQLEALKWVNANILSFGGDPLKVTLFGQSSGAVSAHLHQLSPLGVGLYRAIICQSGSALSHMVEPLNRRVVEDESIRYVEKIGCDPEGSTPFDDVLNCLYQKNPEDLLFEPGKSIVSTRDGDDGSDDVDNIIGDTIAGMGPFDSFAPSLDKLAEEPFIPKHPYLAIKGGEQKDLPVIMGITAYDGGIALAQNWDRLAEINGNWSYYGPKIVLNLPFDHSKRYDRLISNVTRHFYTGKAPLSFDETQGIVDLITDSAFRAPALKASHLQARTQEKPLYYYELNHQPSKSMVEIFGINTGAASNGKLKDFGVTAYDDLSFLFNSPFMLDEAIITEEDLDTREAMVMMWTNFAKYGDPTPFENPKLPTWTRYKIRGQAYMQIGPLSQVKRASHSNAMYFWQKLYWFDLDRAFQNNQAVQPQPPSYRNKPETRLKPISMLYNDDNGVAESRDFLDESKDEEKSKKAAQKKAGPAVYNSGLKSGSPLFESLLPSSESSIYKQATSAFRPTYSYSFGSDPGQPQYRYLYL